MQIIISYGIGFGSQKTDLEVDDALTDDEIYQEAFEYICQNYLDIGWKKAEASHP